MKRSCAMKNRQSVTELDVQKAIGKFLREGGLIKHLPDEVVPRNLLVGQKWGMYETVMDTQVTSGEGA